ncbi:hypothetical protein D3C72_2124050 [compost metagenome]
MAGHAFVEAEFGEQPEGGGQALLAVQALLAHGGELRRARQVAVAGLDLFGQAGADVVGALSDLRGVHGCLLLFCLRCPELRNRRQHARGRAAGTGLRPA